MTSPRRARQNIPRLRPELAARRSPQDGRTAITPEPCSLTAAVLGSVLAAGYLLLMPTVTGNLGSGAPQFDAELWLANALLAVTFPLLAIHLDYFALWPFSTSPTVASPTAATGSDAAGITTTI